MCEASEDWFVQLNDCGVGKAVRGEEANDTTLLSPRVRVFAANTLGTIKQQLASYTRGWIESRGVYYVTKC